MADILQDLVDVVAPLDYLPGRALLLQARLVYHSPSCRMCVMSNKNGEEFHSISRKVSNFRAVD